jgi:hypothetical protein
VPPIVGGGVAAHLQSPTLRGLKCRSRSMRGLPSG